MSSAELGDPQVASDFAAKLQSAVQSASSKAQESTQVDAPAPESPQTEEAQTSDTQAAPPVEAENRGAEAVGELRSKQLAAIARRERELREREEALKARETPAPSKPEQSALTLDITQITDNLDLQAYAIYREMGSDSPKEVIDRVEKLHTQQRFSQFENQQGQKLDEDEIRKRVAEATQAEMKLHEIHSIVDSGIPSDYALVSAEAQEDPMEVKKAIAQYMDYVLEAEGRWCSPLEAVKAINSELVAYAERLDRYRGVNQPAKAETKQPQGTPTPNEAPLSNADLSSTPDRVTEEVELDIEKRIAMARSKLGIG